MPSLRPSAVVRATGALLALAVVTPALGAQAAAARIASASPGVVPVAASPITWTAGSRLPLALDHHVSFVTSGTRGDFLHVIGGSDGTRARNASFRAKVGRDGSVGEWEPGETLPAARSGMAFASDGRYAVLAGGRGSENELTPDVLITNIWADGRIGAWKSTAFTLPAKRSNTATVLANGYIYVTGGTDGAGATSTVYRAKISRSGEVSAWTTLEALPGARSHHAALVHDGAIYLVGGIAGDAAGTAGEAKPLGDVVRATINKDGSLGAWQTVSTLDAAFSTHAAVVRDGYLYVIGGLEDNARTSDRVVRAALLGNGALGAWETTSSSLPAPRGHVCTVPMLRDHLFSVGGSREGKAIDEVVVGKFTN